MRGLPLLVLAIAVSVRAIAGSDSPIASDPTPDVLHPASLVEIAVPSHGAQLLGALYLPTGSGPHPAAIIFHGFPGYEQNLDIAQTLRRAGYAVLAVHYRGSWGVAGTFSHGHAIEDADAEVDWLSSPATTAQYAIDPTRIVVIGHSMGGYMALSAAAHHPAVLTAISISGANLGHKFAGRTDDEKDKAVAESAALVNPVDLLPLAGATALTIQAEDFDHRNDWLFSTLAPDLAKRPVLLITANDGTEANSAALLQSLTTLGDTRARLIKLNTDHPFSDHRIALEGALLSWLGPLVPAQALP